MMKRRSEKKTYSLPTKPKRGHPHHPKDGKSNSVLKSLMKFSVIDNNTQQQRRILHL